MKVSPELYKKIEAVLRGFVINFGEPLELRKIAGDLSVLPLFLDMGGCYCIRPNGEIVSFLWDKPDKLDVETNTRIQNIVLFQGAKKYPELKELLPVRLPDAIECPHCKGTGTLQGLAEHGVTLKNIVCYCGGIGWLPQSES